MSAIVDDINDVLVAKHRQLILNALNLKGSDPDRPTLFGLIDWSNPPGPRGFEDQIQVSTNASAGTFSEGGNYNAAGRAEYVDFVLGHSRYHFVIEATESQLAKLDVAGPMRQDKIADFLAKQIEAGSEAVIDVMENDLIVNTPSIDPDGFVGLDYIASPTNTYGTVNATTYTNTGAILTAAGGALTLAGIDSLANTFEDTNGGKFNMCLTSRSQLQKYEDLAPSTNQVPTPYNVTVTGPDGREREYSVGYTKHWYRGRPVFAIQGYPTDVFDLIDTRNMQGQILRNWKIKKFDQIEADKVRWVVTLELVFVLRNRRKSIARLDGLT